MVYAATPFVQDLLRHHCYAFSGQAKRPATFVSIASRWAALEKLKTLFTWRSTSPRMNHPGQLVPGSSLTAASRRITSSRLQRSTRLTAWVKTAERLAAEACAL